MIGLSHLAMVLAESRCPTLQGFWTRHKIEPCRRDVLSPAIHPFSAEYYAICDRITRGETP